MRGFIPITIIGGYVAGMQVDKPVPYIGKPHGYDDVRTMGNCTFPIELYIIQDETWGFDDVYEELKGQQLKLMYDTLSAKHPGSTFGVGTHRDIPIRPLGDPSDYCWKFRIPLSSSYEELYHTYDQLFSSGGEDLPENQFGSIVAACQSRTPGWSNPLAARLLIVATDAAPHFAGDGANRPEHNLKEFSGKFDEANAREQCVTEYYPSPEQVADAIKERGAYVGFLIFGGEFGAVPMSAWEWFNGFIGQPSDFAAIVQAGAGDFWKQLSAIISKLESIECRLAPTTTPTPTTKTTTITTTTTTTRAPGSVGWSFVFKTEDRACSCPADSAEVIKKCTDELPDDCRYTIEGTYYTEGSVTTFGFVEISCPNAPYRLIRLPEALDVRGVNLIDGYPVEDIVVEVKDFTVNFTAIDNQCEYKIGLQKWEMVCEEIAGGRTLENFGAFTAGGGLLHVDLSEMSRVGGFISYGYNTSCTNYRSIHSPWGSFDYYKITYTVESSI